MKKHLLITTGGLTACHIYRNTSNTVTILRSAVTCGNCKRTKLFKIKRGF